jgi:hypothetical protein
VLAVAGILFPELLANIGLSWPGAGVPWYEAGKFQYFASAETLFGVQMLLFAWAEIRRYQDYMKPGSANQVGCDEAGSGSTGLLRDFRSDGCSRRLGAGGNLGRTASC